MLKKIHANGLCQVQFVMQPEMNVGAVWVHGDFNAWEPTSYPMTRCMDGSYERTISLKAGQSYRFRYRLANGDWENDWVPTTISTTRAGVLIQWLLPDVIRKR